MESEVWVGSGGWMVKDEVEVARRRASAGVNDLTRVIVLLVVVVV